MKLQTEIAHKSYEHSMKLRVTSNHQNKKQSKKLEIFLMFISFKAILGIKI